VLNILLNHPLFHHWSSEAKANLTQKLLTSSSSRRDFSMRLQLGKTHSCGPSLKV